MNERKIGPFPPVGISSLLVIVSVLCLTVFVLLSIATVRGDVNLSNKTLDTIKGYYEADYEAEEILAQLRREGISGIYSYQCEISDTQQLEVEVKIDGEDYQILRWQAVSTAPWQLDDSLPVWQKEAE